MSEVNLTKGSQMQNETRRLSLVSKWMAVTSVIVLGLPTIALAQDNRGWIDVNFGIAIAAEKGYTVQYETPLFRETARFGADYRFPTGANFDFGGGAMISRVFGVGISISGTAHLDSATVRATIPHPARFNVPASASAETNEQLKKAEGAIHLQAVIAGNPSENVRVKVFAGPSYFRVKQDTLDDIRYSQSFAILGGNTISITGAPFSESEATAWGFHAGGDASWFFSRIVGVGGFARFSRATIEQADLGNTPVENKAGGFQAGGGVRFRF